MWGAVPGVCPRPLGGVRYRSGQRRTICLERQRSAVRGDGEALRTTACEVPARGAPHPRKPRPHPRGIAGYVSGPGASQSAHNRRYRGAPTAALPGSVIMRPRAGRARPAAPVRDRHVCATGRSPGSSAGPAGPEAQHVAEDGHIRPLFATCCAWRPLGGRRRDPSGIDAPRVVKPVLGGAGSGRAPGRRSV
jgi:hypothetical protein